MFGHVSEYFLGSFAMGRHFFGSAVIASLLAATSAFAADLPARTYAKAPVIVDPGYNWTGFYAGINGGYSWGRANTTFTPLVTFFPTVPFSPMRTNVNGGLAGGQIGYNWQVNPTWVLGLEADGQWTGERTSTSQTTVSARYGSNAIGIPVGAGPDFNAIVSQTANVSYDLQWFATFRGRAGWLADTQTLLYGTGGLAIGGFRYSAQNTFAIQVFGPGLGGLTPGFGITVPGATVSQTDTRVGWTLGAGVERKFTPNWSAKLEYLYLDFGSKTVFTGTVNESRVSFRDNIVRVGINYEWYPTVVAKY
jgi:outer membrane immunogenic protein